MRIGLLLMVPGVLLGCVAVAPAQNLVNPDFESPGVQGQTPTGWTVTRGRFFLDSQKRNTGAFAGKLDGGEAWASARQDVSVTPGEKYQLSGFWRNGDKIADFDVVVVEVRWLNALGGSELGRAAILDSGPVVGDWTPFQTSELTAPHEARAARIILTSRFAIGAFDSLYWGKPGGPPPSLAANRPSAGAPATAPAPFSEVSIPPLSQVLTATPAPGAVLARAAAPPPAAVTPAAATPAAGAAPGWSTDLREARRVAAAEKKPILVFFSGDEPVSRQLEETVFRQPLVAQALARVVCVKLDFEKNRNLAVALQVTRPGIVTIYDSQGEFLARLDGPFTADQLLGRLRAIGQ